MTLRLTVVEIRGLGIAGCERENRTTLCPDGVTALQKKLSYPRISRIPLYTQPDQRQ